MHELGIVFHVIDRLEELAKENSLTKIARVTLQIGEVSGIVPSYLTDCWKWAAAKKELLAGSELNIQINKAVTVCRACGKTYPTVEFAKICPYCKSQETELLSGNEMMIKEIEVPDDSELSESEEDFKSTEDSEQSESKEIQNA